MLKEKLSARQTAGLVVSVAGVAFIVIAGRTGAGAAGTAGDSLRGVILIVGALLCAGFFNIFSRRASASFSPVETTFAMMASGAVFFGVLAVVQDRITGASGILTRGTPQAWLAVAYLGILSSVIAFFLVNYTLAKLKASQSAVFGTLTTLIALVAGVLLRGESFGIAKAAGALMIVAGVWATNRPAKKEGPLPAAELPPEGGR
jgi:drug/metabolite transporter (DMT)-like permease